MAKFYRSLSLLSVATCIAIANPTIALADDDDHDTTRAIRHKVSGMFKGMASFYNSKLHGKRTASGQVYDEERFTCAHRTLPFGTPLEVTNPETGTSCEVVVTDRGPFRSSRVVDLSKAAAKKLGITGLAHVVCKVRGKATGSHENHSGRSVATEIKNTHADKDQASVAHAL